MRNTIAAALAAATLAALAPMEALAGSEPYPAVIGSASGSGRVRVYENAASGSPSPTQFFAFASSFNSEWEMSSALVDNDTTRDLVVSYTAFGCYPEVRAYSGTTGELIAAVVADTELSDGTVSARLARVGTNGVLLVGKGGAAPSLRIIPLPGSAASPVTITLPAAYSLGVQFATGRIASGRDAVATVPRFNPDNECRVFDMANGDLIRTITLAGGSPLSSMSVEMADVRTSALGSEVIVATAGTDAEVRVYSLDDVQLSQTSLGTDTLFAVRAVGVPTGEGPSGGSRVLVFGDGNFGTDSQVYSVDPVASTATAANTGQFANFPGLRGALGPVDAGSGQADLWIGAPAGFEAQVQRTTQAYANVGTGFFAFDTNYSGGVTVAVEDVEGSGAAEIITGAGAGAPPIVRIFSNTNPPRLVRQFLAYPPSFRGGVRVATGDLDGDGKAEIVTGPASGGVASVNVFNPAGETLAGFLAMPVEFQGGVNVAVGDVAGDGAPEIVVTPNAPGRATQGRIFRTDGTLVTEFQFASAALDAAVTIAVGDVDGDGKDDIVAGARDGANTTGVRVFRGKELPDSGDLIASFAPFAPDVTLAANVGLSRTGDAGEFARIIVGGSGPGTQVRVFSGGGSFLQEFNTFSAGTTLGVNPGTIRIGTEAPPQSSWVVR